MPWKHTIMPSPHTVEHPMLSSFWSGLRPAALIGLALLGLYGACVEPEELQVEQWDTRDNLGLSPQWLLGSPAQRAPLQERYRDTILEQSESGTWSQAPQEGAIEVTRQRRVAIQHLDQGLRDEDRDPLLVGWWEVDGTELVARACPLEPDDLDLIPPNPDPGAWRQWTIDRAFDRPLTTEEQGPTEAEALMGLMPGLQRWLDRCAWSAGHETVAHGGAGHATIERAQGAPMLAAWWPDTQTLTLNPQLLLWHSSTTSPPTVLNTRSQAIEDDLGWYDCLEAAKRLCVSCLEDGVCRDHSNDIAVDLGGCICVTNSLDYEDCTFGSSDANAPPRVCARRTTNDPTLRACMIAQGGSSCMPPSDNSTDIYRHWIESTQCLLALLSCAQEPEPSLPSHEPNWEQPPPQEHTTHHGSDNSCAAVLDDCGCDDSGSSSSSYDGDSGSSSDDDCGEDSDSDSSGDCGDDCEGDDVDDSGSDCGDSGSSADSADGDCGCEGDGLE
ncbi:MAG: hypothetical protein AAFX99_20165 [Myxococcota bacterium]